MSPEVLYVHPAVWISGCPSVCPSGCSLVFQIKAFPASIKVGHYGAYQSFFLFGGGVWCDAINDLVGEDFWNWNQALQKISSFVRRSRLFCDTTRKRFRTHVVINVAVAILAMPFHPLAAQDPLSTHPPGIAVFVYSLFLFRLFIFFFLFFLLLSLLFPLFLLLLLLPHLIFLLPIFCSSSSSFSFPPALFFLLPFFFLFVLFFSLFLWWTSMRDAQTKTWSNLKAYLNVPRMAVWVTEKFPKRFSPSLRVSRECKWSWWPRLAPPAHCGTKLGRSHSLSKELGSEWASERTIERSRARERSKLCGASEWVSGQANERASDPVLTTGFLFFPDHSAAAAPSNAVLLLVVIFASNALARKKISPEDAKPSRPFPSLSH